MENLKNIRNFQEFKEDSLNEELLWDAIKNLFSKIFSKIDKKLSDSVANFTKKLDGSKSWEESLRFYEEIINLEKNNLEQSLNTVTGPLSLRKIISDNISVIFIQLQEMSNKYQTGELSAKKIFEGQPDIEFFNFDKAEQLNSKILELSNAKIVEINKLSGNPYNEQKLIEYLKNSSDLNINNSAQTFTTEKKKIKLNDKLFEDINQNNNTSPAASNQQNQQQQNQQQKNQIEKLKETTKKWITEKLYLFSINKIKSIKTINKFGNKEDPFDIASKGSKATRITNSVSGLLRNIVNIEDKEKLLKIRDAIALANGKTPEDYKKQFPL